jgi:translocation and assembly module TamA
LVQALRSEGFFGSQVVARIDGEKEPIQVIFNVDLGPPYSVQSIDIRFAGEGESPAAKLPEPNELGLQQGETARGKTILDGEKKLLHWFKTQGFPFPQVVKREVTVDHATRTVSVVFQVDSGELGRFGPTEITGLETIDEVFVRGRIRWKEGDEFNPGLLSDTRKDLVATGLFATVAVVPAQSLQEGKYLPVVIRVKERKHRSVKMGVSYRTDEGLGERVTWEHRNLLGKGERLTLSEAVSQITLSASGAFRKPAFLRTDQSLLLNLRVAEEDPEAFTSRSLGSSMEIERVLATGKAFGAGLAFKASEVEQLGAEERFNLLSLPLRFNWDTSNDLLDPTRGGRLALRLAPFHDMIEDDIDFVRGYMEYSRYVQIKKRPSLVLAGRGALGSIVGEARDSIPADERFYAGGGESVRGFPFQSLGPLRGTKPVGGRSLLELSMEFRLKVTDTLGFVAFLDAGSAFESVFPDREEKIGLGTGLGIRYYTPIGPLRFDIAFPLNRRDEIDEKFQIYLSLGQAF